MQHHSEGIMSRSFPSPLTVNSQARNYKNILPAFCSVKH